MKSASSLERVHPRLTRPPKVLALVAGIASGAASLCPSSAAAAGPSSSPPAAASPPRPRPTVDRAGRTPAAPPSDMVLVPEGPFSMGGGPEADERPAHRVHLRAFLLDRDEVTRGAYAACVSAKVCPALQGVPPTADPRLPVTRARWTDADTYCRFIGKRLPSEAEWEKAARGPEGRSYPWGEEPDCGRANFGNYQGEGRCPTHPGAPVAVGSFPEGASPYGAQDLAGNVWEWVADRYDPRYYARSPKQDPSGPATGARRVARGGACCSMFGLPRASNRIAFPPDYRDEDLGFRCARDP